MIHTPGPWKQGELNRVIAADGSSVCVILNWPHPLQFTANRSLVSAAPELLDTLKAAGVLPEGYCWCRKGCWDCETPECIQARAAIKKAEGGI
jgi:hypothetical protein